MLHHDAADVEALVQLLGALQGRGVDGGCQGFEGVPGVSRDRVEGGARGLRRFRGASRDRVEGFPRGVRGCQGFQGVSGVSRGRVTGFPGVVGF